MVIQISDNEIYSYLLIKYIKRVLWRVAKRLSYIQDARCVKVNLLHRFSKITQMSDLMTICPVGGELFHADGHDEVNSHFSQFCKQA